MQNFETFPFFDRNILRNFKTQDLNYVKSDIGNNFEIFLNLHLGIDAPTKYSTLFMTLTGTGAE
jgi:hypothetical protein